MEGRGRGRLSVNLGSNGRSVWRAFQTRSSTSPTALLCSRRLCFLILADFNWRLQYCCWFKNLMASICNHYCSFCDLLRNSGTLCNLEWYPLHMVPYYWVGNCKVLCLQWWRCISHGPPLRDRTNLDQALWGHTSFDCINCWSHMLIGPK